MLWDVRAARAGRSFQAYARRLPDREAEALPPEEAAREARSISARGNVTAADVTAEIENMRAARRERRADDRRVKLLTLTEQGRKAAADIYQAGDAMMRAVTGDWTRDEAHAFTERMERFVQATTDYTNSLRRAPDGT